MLDRLKALGRYSPEHYVETQADTRLFKFWQLSLRNAAGKSAGERQTYIPLIADAGIGKTNLLANFSEKGSKQAPVLMLLARDLMFDAEDSLVRTVIEQLQGTLDPTVRQKEERHVAMMLSGKTPLTVVLDGIDEATNTVGVQKAVGYWLRSTLGRQSVLVTSSRPEFWRRCRDPTWAASIVNDFEHPKAARSLRHEQDISALDPVKGIELPKQFSTGELQQAWLKHGRDSAEFWNLPNEVRQTLMHPFTFMSAMELLDQGSSIDGLTSQGDVLKLWVTKRLEAESDATLRISSDQLESCLKIIARIAATHVNLWLRVDELSEVPRFDQANPPGPVVERIIAANILETHPEQPDQIRFTFESVQDYFLASSTHEEIARNPSQVARLFEKETLSACATRLECIGAQISAGESSETFVKELLKLDPVKAAIVLRAHPGRFSSQTRSAVCEALRDMLHSKQLSEQAIATQLLGRVKCDESEIVLRDYWSNNEPSKHIRHVIAHAAVTHGIVELVSIVFQTRWFIRERYFVDIRPELEATSEDFQTALKEYACQYLPADQHSDDYQRAITVLGYMADPAAVEAIKKRTTGQRPFFYETLCLLVIGSPQAIECYSRIVGEFIAFKESDEEDENARYAFAVFPSSYIGSFVTTDSENYVLNLLRSDKPRHQIYGKRLATKLGTATLLKEKVIRWNVEGYMSLSDPDSFGQHLGAENWLSLWNDGPTLEHQATLVKVAKDLRDPRIETILIQNLANIEIAGSCAQSLAGMGSQRACTAIRKLLRESQPDKEGKNWNAYCAFWAIHTLRDEDAVEDVVAFLEANPGSTYHESASGLAAIGSPNAEDALFSLKNQSDKMKANAFLLFGTKRCVEKAIEIAKKQNNPVDWILQECHFCFSLIHGWASHHFRVDVEIEPLIDFIGTATLNAKQYDCLMSMLDGVDSPAIRVLLREFCDKQGTSDDVEMDSPVGALSNGAYRELCDRGDDHVLEQYVSEEVDRHKGYVVGESFANQFSYFDREKVLAEFHKLLGGDSSDDAFVVTVLDLVGFLGSDSDLELLERHVESESISVSNAAFTAKLRLSDPLRLAENW
jgi:hypothetical protein